MLPPSRVSFGCVVTSDVQFWGAALGMVGRAITPLVMPAVPVQPARVALSVTADAAFGFDPSGTAGDHVTVPVNFVHVRPVVAEPAGAAAIAPTGRSIAAASS